MASLQMAAIGMMIAGAILNAAAFTGGGLIAKSISGKSDAEVLAETKRKNRALEKYQEDLKKYQKEKDILDAWVYEREKEKNQAGIKFKNTDSALDFYNQMHQDRKINLIEPKFSNYYSPPQHQKNGELIYVSIGMLGMGFLANKFF